MAKVDASIRMKSEILHWIDEKVEESVYASRTYIAEFAPVQLMKSERMR